MFKKLDFITFGCIALCILMTHSLQGMGLFDWYCKKVGVEEIEDARLLNWYMNKLTGEKLNVATKNHYAREVVSLLEKYCSDLTPLMSKLIVDQKKEQAYNNLLRVLWSIYKKRNEEYYLNVFKAILYSGFTIFLRHNTQLDIPRTLAHIGINADRYYISILSKEIDEKFAKNPDLLPEATQRVLVPSPSSTISTLSPSPLPSSLSSLSLSSPSQKSFLVSPPQSPKSPSTHNKSLRGNKEIPSITGVFTVEIRAFLRQEQAHARLAFNGCKQ